ncbi:MAG TPA: hypothetical protein VI383_11170 [Gemmatimonadales bacterium]|nr:hypothetical protein [Gemmatimonadales bacterium]
MRNHQFSHRWAVPTALALLSMSTLSRLPAQEKALSLTGTWKYNPDKTTAERRGAAPDPAAREGYATGGRPRVGTGITEPKAGGGGGGGGGAVTGPLAVYSRALPELVMVHTDSTITITDPAGQARSYWLDGRKEAVQLPGIEPTETSARWKGGKLTIERKIGTSGTVREVYSMSKDRTELTVEVRLTGSALAQPVDQKRIYDGGPPKQ